MSFSAHKTYGPKCVGALFVRRKPRVRIEAQTHGGGHERGMRSGTLPTHQIVGMGEAYRIAAITNGNADIHRTPLGPYFSASISAPAFGAAKPDPRIFHAACDALGVEPEATLHIGDDLELDVLAARRAGLHAAWLLRPELGRPSVVNNTERRGALQPYFFSLLSIDNAVQR